MYFKMTGGKLWADLEDNGPGENILNADENLNMWRDNANPHPQVEPQYVYIANPHPQVEPQHVYNANPQP